MPHPTTIHAVADLRRQDLLTEAERERRVISAGAQAPRLPVAAIARRLAAFVAESFGSIDTIVSPLPPLGIPRARW